jgi:succinate-acetate transporter protein
VSSAPVRIVLRPIGSPLTIGMSGLAIASLVESGLDLHWVPTTQSVQVGLILLAVPFVLQLLASIFSYLARDGSAGAATGVLATTWLALGLLHIASGSAGASASLGLLLVASAGVLALSVVVVSSTKPLPGAVFSLAALRFAIAGVYNLSAADTWKTVAGIAGLIVCAGAAYCVLAFELEGQQRRPVLPTLRRGRAALAPNDEFGAQADGISREAGIRQTT